MRTTRVRFDACMMGRLGRVVGRLRALRSQREGRGVQRWVGSGDTFAGHRTWQPGEDARHLDWDLFGRLDQPFVRVYEREAAESWVLLLDVSDSMDLGLGAEQSKLQLACEVVLGVAALALEARATLTVATSDGQRQVVRRTADQGELMGFLARIGAADVGLGAGGGAPLGALLSAASTRERAGRVLVVGDLDEVNTDEVLGLDAPGRDVVVLRVLERTELAPVEALFGAGERVVELAELESGEGLPATVATARAYERLLGAELDHWRRVCARHRVTHHVVEAGHDTTFEDVLDALVAGGAA